MCNRSVPLAYNRINYPNFIASFIINWMSNELLNKTMGYVCGKLAFHKIPRKFLLHVTLILGNIL